MKASKPEPAVNRQSLLSSQAVTGSIEKVVSGRNQLGFGVIEMLVVLVAVALGGAMLYGYMSSSVRSVEKVQQEGPLGFGRVSADQMTLTTVRTTLQVFHARNGRWPPPSTTCSPPTPARPCTACPATSCSTSTSATRCNSCTCGRTGPAKS